MLQRSRNPDLSINKFYWHCQGHILCLSTHLFVKNLVCEAALCLIQDQSIFSEEKWTIKYVNMSLLQHCLSQQLRRNSTSYHFVWFRINHLCLIQDQSTFSEEEWTIKYVNMSLLQHCLSQQLRRNSTSYQKNKVKNTSLWNNNPFKYISH